MINMIDFHLLAVENIIVSFSVPRPLTEQLLIHKEVSRTET